MTFPFLSLHFRYLARHYIVNILALLMGLTIAFATIDYFQHSLQLEHSSNYKILYLYYKWQEALALLYPLAIIFAGIMTKISLIKSSNMVVLHSFGYTKKALFFPFLTVAVMIYILFALLHMTEFSYAKDKAEVLLHKKIDAYAVNDLFFIYQGDFIYVKKLDPLKKTMEGLSLFKLSGNDLLFSLHAKKAVYKEGIWEAHDIVTKRLIYDRNGLKRYVTETKEKMDTLKGYKPKMIESIYEGKALSVLDTYMTWKVLEKQGLNTRKLRASFYYKMIFPLFSIVLLLILFFKIPFHARYMNLPLVIASSLGVTFLLWGIFFALNQMGHNGVILPELAMPLPMLLLWLYALRIYFRGKETI